ncbi:MAG: hypothetical protein E7035_04450 [Verrucomicrobiaceae bacterium]|nr:hypothetical protein [Verrucomicrobiaceae bacterium]
MDTLKPVISLSTSFLQSRFPNDGYAMMCRAAELGFEYVELGHSTPITSIEGILKAVKEGVVKVSSLHNFCPVPPFASGAVPNLFSPSTSNKNESQQWRRHTLNTLDFAVQTGAKAIVSHSGAVSYFFFRPDAKISKIIDEQKLSELQETDTFVKARDTFLKKTSARALTKDYKYLLENLNAIETNLEQADVFIGIENREGIAELPLDWTFNELFEIIGERKSIKVWHDLGHSKIKELKHLYTQRQLIEQTIDKIAGWHIHDCTQEGQDHLGLGDGCIDFKSLKEYFNPQKHIFTLELNSKVRSVKASDSLKRVQDLLA